MEKNEIMQTYRQFTFYDCMYTRWKEYGTSWIPLHRGTLEWQRMADVVPFRLVTLDAAWEKAQDRIALKIDSGTVDDPQGHVITFTVAQCLAPGVIMTCKVFEDSDDIEVLAKGVVSIQI